MLFETRDSIPEVSEPWTAARDAFLAGRTRQAWDLAQANRPLKVAASPNDFILSMEIARGCAAYRHYAALERMATARFPSNPFVQLYHARMLLTRGRFQRGITYLHSLESTLGKVQPLLWSSSLANMYGSAGFEKSCRAWLEKSANHGEVTSPLALYQISCAYEGLRHWDEAIRIAEKCIVVAPRWSRVRGYYADCLLARGHAQEAKAQIEEVARLGLEEAEAECSLAMLAMSQGDFEASRVELGKLLERWPNADYARWIKRTLCILHYEVGDFAAAAKLADGAEKQMGLPPVPTQSSGRRRFIPLPLIMQNKNQCVPTTVAMAAFAQGRTFDPETLFKEMEGREGTAMWRMRNWCKAHQLHVAAIRLEKEAITAMLDQGVVLIGVLEGLFNNHVDVICGYNDDLQTLYVRDPVSWAPIAWPWEPGLGRYSLQSGVIAIFDEGREDLKALAQAWRSDSTEALMDLDEAVDTGNLEAAESAFARIPDESPTAFLRDLCSLYTVISPKTFQTRMETYANDAGAEGLVRVRALLALDSDAAKSSLQKLLDSPEGKAYGPGIRKFLALSGLMEAGRWEEAKTLIDELLERSGAVSRLWEMKSDVFAELGDQSRSADALEKAIELEPMRAPLRQKQLRRSIHHITQADYLKQIDDLLAMSVDNRQLLWAKADALREAASGKEYEKASQVALRFYPREPQLYVNLLTWYQNQGRGDLEKVLLETAKLRMPETFGDKLASEASASPGEAPAAESTELPTDKSALMTLIWNLGDPKRSSALEHLVELEKEGNLHWYESARLLACRLLSPATEGSTEVAPATLLPANPPGAIAWYAGLLCETLTDRSPNIAVAQAVVDWLKKVVDFRSFPDLWFSRVLLLEAAMHIEEALVELTQIVERYPTFATALYRLGVVKRHQGDLKSAQSYFERALVVDPGRYGAQRNLADIHDDLGDAERALVYARQLRTKLPYSLPLLAEELQRIRLKDSLTAALKALDEYATDFPLKLISVLRAKLHYSAEQIEPAERILREIPFEAETAEDDLFEDYLKLKLEIARKRENQAQVLECCELGLKRWPDSNVLLELKAECLAKNQPQQSRELLQSVILKGSPTAKTIAAYRGLLNGDLENAMWELVRGVEPHRREELATLIADAFETPKENPLKRKFLNWTLESMPSSLELRWRLASHYYDSRMQDAAIAEAREALRREPDHPGVQALLGRFLFETSPKEALPYLENACKHDRTPWRMFDLARCRQSVGDFEGSRKLHWEALEIDPSRMASWTNLYLMSQTHFSQDLGKLWRTLQPGLEGEHGLYDEYFHVAAVKLAVQLKKKLPPEWQKVALQRFDLLLTNDGYWDEKSLLPFALLAWRMKRPQEFPATPYVPTSRYKWYKARFQWPGLAWIPKA